MSDPVTKKKNKKRRKKAKASATDGKDNGGLETKDTQNKTPKQSSDKDHQVITTAKCQRCKGTFRQMVQNGRPATPSQLANWMCPSCVQTVKADEERQKQLFQGTIKEVMGGASGGCDCAACVAKRENAVSPEVERDAHITQSYWMEIRQIVRRIYRANMSLSNPSNKSSLGSEKMRTIVKKLCSRDPHQFFQRLETLAREYLLEVKVRLLEQLSCGFNSPQLAIEFIQMLLDEYNTLSDALPALLYLLEPLEDCDYVQKLGMTIELMNKNIFRELIFAESFMSSNLPLITAQLRLASLASDPYHRSAADDLSQRYSKLDSEMVELSRIWKSAKDHLNNQQERRAQIKIDGENFKQQITNNGSNKDRPTDDGGGDKSTDTHKHNGTSTSSGSHGDTTTSPTHSPSTIQMMLQSKDSFKSQQAMEWSKLLFQCIKPVGEPEFKLNGDIATHTITLHLDMTELDLSEAKPCCKRGDINKYRKLGLTVEEVVEVAMKLNALKSLGIHLNIEDLFDDEGFSLSDINETLIGSDVLQLEDVYFLNSDDDDNDRGKGKEGTRPPPSDDDDVDLQRAQQVILLRQETSNGRSRQQDFLQGMTMKIRFMKRLTVEDLDKNFVADGGRVIFSSCDQVQMKLTQLELNSIRLVASNACIGDVLGLELDPPLSECPPMKKLCEGEKTAEDYAFIHTDSHCEFMDLLLEKRRTLESVVSEKQRQRMKEVSKKETKNGEKPSDQILPKYQVVEQQESTGRLSTQSTSSSKKPPTNSTSATSDDGVTGESDVSSMKLGVKPIFLPNSSQPCQCSACVGAVAAIVQPSYRLTPSDPAAGSVMVECTLTSPVIGSGDKSSVIPSGDKDTKPFQRKLELPKSKSEPAPLSEEGVWQNWMSTSGSAQIESETLRSHHHTHYSCYHGDNSYKSSCSVPCDCHDHVSMVTGSTSSTNYSSHSHQPYSSSTSGRATPQTTPTSSDPPTGCTSVNGTSGGGVASSNTANGETPRRYCPCCYCELFGHNGPPTAPTSHNFTKQRDKMRAKLDDKRKRKETEGGSKMPHTHTHTHSHSHTHMMVTTESTTTDTSHAAANGDGSERQTSVEELLAFIEGGENEPSTSSRAAKRARRKQKKQAASSSSSGPMMTSSSEQNGVMVSQQNGVGKQHCQQNDTSEPHPHANGAPPTKGSQSSVNKKSKKVMNGVAMATGFTGETMDLEEMMMNEDFDDYDDELEEFKKFCFASAPVENRKKIAVSLNMTDFMSKMK